MMVENDTSSVEYQLSTSTGPFSIPFYFIENGHIVAELYTQNGDDFNKTTLIIDVDYYLNGAGDKNGGQLTLLSAHSGATLLIYRDPDATQLTSYLATGKFPATSHERALDKLTMLIQKFGWWWDSLALKKPNIFANYYDALNNRIRNLRDPSQAQDAATKSYVDSSDSDLQHQITSNFNRSLRVPDSYISQLPSAEDRAWKGLGFDGAGQPKLQDPAGTGLWGYVPVSGSFENGGALRQRFEVLLWESTQEYWRWDGALPKTVPAGSAPETAGGTGKGKWIDVNDATLRANLGSSEEGMGDDLIAHVQNGVFTGTLSKYLNSAIPIVTPMMFGAAGDGSTNDDDAFSRMLSTINSLTQGVWAIDGMGRTYVLTKTLNADPGKFCMRNMRLDFSSATNFDATTPLYAIIFDATATDYVELDWRCSVYEKLEIIGTGYRTTDNIHPWKFAPSNSLHGLTINDCYIRDFNSGYVFGSNAYLITFNKVRVHRCFTGILTTVDTGEETTLSNCGENIRFNYCTFDSLHRIAYMSSGAWEMRFNDPSFDYTGRTTTEAYDQFYLGGACLFNIYNPHFESGNENAGWYGVGFRTAGAANINIVGGTIRFVSTTYNDCDYFFYDESGLASFSIVDTTINGWGIKQWANTGLRKFRPNLKGETSQFSLHTTDDPIVWNPNNINNLDYQVRGLRGTTVYTDRYTNDRITVVESSITKDDGTVVPTLLITKLAGYGQLADFIVKARRPVKADHNSIMHGKITFVPGANRSSARVITAITGCLTPGRTTPVGVMESYMSTTITSTAVSLLDPVPWYEINTSWGANKSAQFLRFEYDMIRLDLSNLAEGDAIHVHSLQWFGAF
ncbi:hypothetical protein NL319_22490 [Klebsiella pneumoniae]|nr:hypothetical protein [Klebsiella pneumoniae]